MEDISMCTKHVLIGFADPRLKISDHLDDLKKAIDYANINLRARHKSKISIISEPSLRLLEILIEIPKEKYDSFSVGAHLKGISHFLLHNCSFPYEEYRIGTRLLCFF